jgi:signal transduction histidine kinase
MRPRSLRLRLFLSGALTILVALVLVGVGLVLLFEHHVERSMYDDLDIYVRHLAEGLAGAAGQAHMAPSAGDPRFDMPGSGFYWQIADKGLRHVERSRSLQDVTLKNLPSCASDGETHFSQVAGPWGQTLVAAELCLPNRGASGVEDLRILAGIDLASVTNARSALVPDVVVHLFLLALVLALATWIQVGLGLAPLATLRGGLAKIARGKRRRLSVEGPLEIQPLIDELNGLLDEHDKDIERARNHAADLAHGLKTPLSALAADARLLRRKGETEIADSLERIGDAMHRHVTRELTRARTRRKHLNGAPPETPVAEVVETLWRTLARTGADVDFEARIDADMTVTLDRTDLMEVLGNLLENAVRYANGSIRVSATQAPSSCRLVVEDDGLGLPEGGEILIRQRGGRLDESGAAGLGLAIVQDVLDAHGATMDFSRSELGGLRVSIELARNHESHQ